MLKVSSILKRFLFMKVDSQVLLIIYYPYTSPFLHFKCGQQYEYPCEIKICSGSRITLQW